MIRPLDKSSGDISDQHFVASEHPDAMAAHIAAGMRVI
jgi:hypothetical protein